MLIFAFLYCEFHSLQSLLVFLQITLLQIKFGRSKLTLIFTLLRYELTPLQIPFFYKLNLLHLNSLQKKGLNFLLQIKFDLIKSILLQITKNKIE